MPNPQNLRGGKRKGAGRPPDWLKKKCAEIADKNKLVEILAHIAVSGEKDSDRLRAIEMILDRSNGKPVQAVSGVDGGPITVQMIHYGGKA